MPEIKTALPIEPANLNINAVVPEFLRAADVRRIFALRKGTLYNLLADRKIRGCLLRVRGKKSGVRLFSADSIREYIRPQMAEGPQQEER